MKFRVQANKLSSLRTRNRIKEHNGVFSIIQRMDSVPCLDGSPGILLKSGEWLGWFRQEEIMILEKVSDE